ncbi:hypothetical protein [Flavobacterium sp.]|uniref:hypothetical protein n=1 Tax=Flavobacterium sp. TaxID=239 RepID=UPI002626E754|nr:hypothetical protein [Flavobacterium sp.]MDG2433921.1 hypothetical protein [Flavobacterium sp.]
MKPNKLKTQKADLTIPIKIKIKNNENDVNLINITIDYLDVIPLHHHYKAQISKSTIHQHIHDSIIIYLLKISYYHKNLVFNLFLMHYT